MDFEGDVEAKSWHRKLAVNYKRKYKDKKTQSEVKVLTLVAATAAVLVLVLLLVAGTRLVSKGKENRMKAQPWYKWIALKDEAEGKGVLIYSKSWCPYSQRAKRIFDELDTEYVAVELDQIEDGAKVQDALASITGIRTVPQVFVGGKLIGGHDDTKALFNKGKLQKLVPKGKENRVKAEPEPWYKWIALKDEAEGKGVLIYSKSWCPYSQRAKRIFDELDTKYVAVELDQIEDGAKVQDALASITGIRTVPQVFVGGKLIGGHDDTNALFDQGKLQKLVSKL